MITTPYSESIKAIRKTMEKVKSSKEYAREFLISAKILTRNGNLRKPYE